jgi:hypothetical protein
MLHLFHHPAGELIGHVATLSVLAQNMSRNKQTKTLQFFLLV